MFSHDSLVEVTKPHYADDPVSAKDAFSNLTLMEALKALVIFCRDRLEQLTPDPVEDRFARDLCALDAMGIARHYFFLREGPEWVGLFAGRLGAVTENQAPMYFGPANRAALDALIHLLRVIDAGNWPPVVSVFGELVGLVDKVLLPDMAETIGEVTKPQVRPKKSTSEKPARIKIVARLTKHHEYRNGSLLNQTPIGVGELARDAPVSKGSASLFFKKKFGNYENYKKACMDSSGLIVALKLLNDEFSPKLLFENAKPQVDAPDE